jgi:hypothetical protein
VMIQSYMGGNLSMILRYTVIKAFRGLTNSWSRRLTTAFAFSRLKEKVVRSRPMFFSLNSANSYVSLRLTSFEA